MDKKDLYMAVRLALTGKTSSPNIYEVMEVLGKEKTIDRLENAILYCQIQETCKLNNVDFVESCKILIDYVRSYKMA